MNIGADGSYIACYGYPRAFGDKSASGTFDQETNEWLLPPARDPPFVNGTDLLCHPSQRIPNQAPNFSRLQTSPGSMIAMRYAENGHVTVPGGGRDLFGKPEKGGTVFVFGTNQPRPSETLENVLHWTRDGKGGDQRGRLLTAQNFDDDRCYQLREDRTALGEARRLQTPNPKPGQPGTDNELFCETDVRIPDDIAVGQPYTLYWVWQWPTAPWEAPGPLNGQDEYYTSCIDIDVVTDLRLNKCGTALKNQDPMTTAVPNFESRTALTVNPLALSSQRSLRESTQTSSPSPVITQTVVALHPRQSSM